MNEKRVGEDRREDAVTHTNLMQKLVDHDTAIEIALTSIASINGKLDPIADGIGSIAFVFKVVVVAGIGAGSILGILELIEQLSS